VHKQQNYVDIRSLKTLNILRFDHDYPSQKDRYSVRWMQSRGNSILNSLAPLSGTTVSNTGYNLMIGETHSFSAKAVNEARLGFNRGWYLPFQEGSNGRCLKSCGLVNYWQTLGLSNLTTDPILYGLPNFNWSGFNGIGGNPSYPLSGLTNTYQLIDNLMIVVGKHNFKMGPDFRRVRSREIGAYSARGIFSFGGEFSKQPGVDTSGSPFADFMLGLTDNAQGLTGDTDVRAHTMYWMGYFQDDWRATRKLTINYGIRYENYRPWRERDGRAPYFKFGFPVGTCFGYNCAPGYLVGGTPNQPMAQANNNDWEPRLGLSYAPFGDNKTVLRASAGIFYSPTDENDQILNPSFNPPNSLSVNVVPANFFTDVAIGKLSSSMPTGSLPPRNSTLSTADWTLPSVIYLPLHSNEQGWRNLSVASKRSAGVHVQPSVGGGLYGIERDPWPTSSR
jgi:hypothetical protein